MTHQTLHEIRAWDNDAPTFSEWYGKENNIYYLNDFLVSNKQPRLEGAVMIKRTTKRTHCDDVPALLRKVLNPGYRVIRF